MHLWINEFLSSFSQVMSYFATAEHEKERLQYFASPEGRDDLYKYNQKERRTVLEVSFGEYIICALSSNSNLWLEWVLSYICRALSQIALDLLVDPKPLGQYYSV